MLSICWWCRGVCHCWWWQDLYLTLLLMALWFYVMTIVPVLFPLSSVAFFCKVYSWKDGRCSERERVQAGIAESTPDLWSYLEKKRATGRAQHEHFNILYDPIKNTGALLPPAAALAPILWPQFYLRWACPTDLDIGGCMPTGLGPTGDLENEARIWAVSLSLLQKVCLSLVWRVAYFSSWIPLSW